MSGLAIKPMPRPYCHGEMVPMLVPMLERAAFICTGCGAQADYEMVMRAEFAGFRLVRTDKPIGPEVVK